jgi:hypothetical protein
MNYLMVYGVVGAICYILYRVFIEYRWRCPACDFVSEDEEVAKKHTALHGRHKPVLKDPY